MADENEIVDGKVRWPAWRYGPNGQSEIYQNEDEVPDGWEDHPSKVGGGGRQQRQQQAPVESPYKDKTDAEVIAELKERKLEYGEKWPRHKLEALLVEDDKKKAK